MIIPKFSYCFKLLEVSDSWTENVATKNEQKTGNLETRANILSIPKQSRNNQFKGQKINTESQL